MRVLLVEDEARLAETIVRGLGLERFVVSVATTGLEGIELAEQEQFDVIILDIMLPGATGYQVLRAIRARDTSTPVLMLTAKNGDHEIADALDLGADDYLSKPFSFVVLVARLRALLRRRVPQQDPILRVGDLTLDPSQRTVRRGEADINLTPREFGLLEFLMRRKEVVLTKTEILRNVWDANYEGPENVVEVYIGYLRRKVDTPFRRASIETRRGVGYRFTESG
ncbi:response regulator transcription factor [Nocardia sp. NPDC005825]|uniref:response regulator transcription factor n=1 Tax=unclassified Nocardia TaxID=2637762 RepID=UPI0033D99196